MKNIIAVLCSICLITVLVSCIPSTRPISEKNETTDSKLLGTWQHSGKNGYDVKLVDDAYIILMKDEKHAVEYRMTLSKIDDEVYASIGLNGGGEVNKGFENFELFALRVYRLYKIEISDSEIKLIWPMNDDGKIPVPENVKTVVFDENDFLIYEKDGDKIKDWIRKNKALFKIKSAKESWGDVKNVYIFKRVAQEDTKSEK